LPSAGFNIFGIFEALRPNKASFFP